MCKKDNQPKVLLTPEQQAAQSFLANYMMQGQTPYTGSFDILTPEARDFLTSLLKSGTEGYGLPTDVAEEMKRMALTGKPVSNEEAFQQQRRVAELASTRAMENALAQFGKYGAKYSTPALGAATRAAAEVQAQSELDILKQVAASQEAARQRQLAATQVLLQGAQTARALGVDAARLIEAANQFKAGMDYEEFKRRYPDVYSVAASVFGRNVDFYMRQKPDYTALALTVIGGIIGAVVGGPAGATAGATVGSTAGAALSGNQGRM